MNFENKGKWFKEAQDKMATRDTMEDPDFLDGDDKVLTFEEEELDIEDNDIEEEPAQKNEDFYKYIDDVPTEEIAKALKELGIKEPYATQKAKIADKLAKRFGLRRVPTPIEMTEVLNALPYFAESSQKNEAMPPISQRKRIEFEDDIVRVYDGNKEIYAGAEDYEPMQDENWKWDNTNKYYKFDKYIKVCCESAQKNEDFRPDDTVPQSKQMDFKKQYLKDKDARKINKNSFYFDGIHAVDDQSGSDIPGAVLGMKYKDLAAALDKFFESSQKNEGSNWEYSVNVLDNYGDVQYSTTCNSQSDIDNAIKKYKARSVELRNADNCRTIEVTKDLVDDDGNILKSQSIKKMSL